MTSTTEPDSTSRPAWFLPLHATSTGKVLLAFSDPADAARMTRPKLARGIPHL